MKLTIKEVLKVAVISTGHLKQEEAAHLESCQVDGLILKIKDQYQYFISCSASLIQEHPDEFLKLVSPRILELLKSFAESGFHAVMFDCDGLQVPELDYFEW